MDAMIEEMVEELMKPKVDLVEAVRKYAGEHYDKGGWDYVIECWERSDIAETIGDAQTVEEAIARVGRAVGVLADVRSDVIGAGGGCPECLSFRRHADDCSRKGSYRLEEDE